MYFPLQYYLLASTIIRVCGRNAFTRLLLLLLNGYWNPVSPIIEYGALHPKHIPRCRWSLFSINKKSPVTHRDTHYYGSPSAGCTSRCTARTALVTAEEDVDDNLLPKIRHSWHTFGDAPARIHSHTTACTVSLMMMMIRFCWRETAVAMDAVININCCIPYHSALGWENRFNWMTWDCLLSLIGSGEVKEISEIQRIGNRVKVNWLQFCLQRYNITWVLIVGCNYQ